MEVAPAGPGAPGLPAASGEVAGAPLPLRTCMASFAATLAFARDREVERSALPACALALWAAPYIKSLAAAAARATMCSAPRKSPPWGAAPGAEPAAAAAATAAVEACMGRRVEK
jgi:hypothetical protein